MTNIIRNSIQTPDGTILQSFHRHDYVSHIDANGETYFIDGGQSYIRMSCNKEPCTSRFVYSDADHETIRECFTWGTRGVDGDQPLTQMLLKDMSIDHIEAILATQSHIRNTHIEKLFVAELIHRGYR